MGNTPDLPPTPCPRTPTPAEQETTSNVGFMVQFRLERIKAIVTLSGGLLAFSVAFRPALREVLCSDLMLVGWIGLGISAFAGILEFYAFERFYNNYRKKHSANGEYVKRKRCMNPILVLVLAVELLAFLVGAVCLALFSWKNLPNAMVKQ